MRSLLIFLLCLLCAPAFADSQPIVWDGPNGTTPTSVCRLYFGGETSFLAYGFPTNYTCVDTAGQVVARNYMTPSCPSGYNADFAKLLCVTDDITVSQPWAISIRGLFVCFTLVFIAFMGYRQGRAGG